MQATWVHSPQPIIQLRWITHRYWWGPLQVRVAVASMGTVTQSPWLKRPWVLLGLTLPISHSQVSNQREPLLGKGQRKAPKTVMLWLSCITCKAGAWPTAKHRLFWTKEDPLITTYLSKLVAALLVHLSMVSCSINSRWTTLWQTIR